MDRPDSVMAAIVEESLVMTERQAAITYLRQSGVPDRVIARLHSSSSRVEERRHAVATARPSQEAQITANS